VPRVSIITGTYLQERYIIETVKSVLAQTYSDFEHIVMDDGSPDNTAVVLEPHMSRIRYFRQENQGNVASRNNALQYATGEYIAILDGDDIWRPEKLRRQVEMLDAHKDVGLTYTGAQEMDEEGVVDSKILVKDISDDPLRHLLVGNAIAFSSIVFRREVLDSGFIVDPRLNLVGDRFLSMQVALQGRRLVCIPEPLLLLRTHSESMRYTSEFRTRYLSQMLLSLDEIHNDPRLSSDHRAIMHTAYAHAYLAAAWLMIGRGPRAELRAARELLFKALSYDTSLLPKVFKQYVKSYVQYFKLPPNS
jgi:glycosyltransferase involved in cell wall biosynthesis